jgi:intein/homing endonuclease
MCQFRSLTPATAYIVGFFAADGALTINKNGSHYIEFTSTDLFHLRKIRSSLSVNNKIGVRVGQGLWKNRYRLQIGSKSLYADLESLGFTRKKSGIMRFPDVPDELLSHFIRGYFDGDGNVLFRFYRRKNRNQFTALLRVVFTSCSRLFLHELSERVARACGLAGGSLRRENNYYRLVYSVKDSLKVLEFLYNGAHPDALFLKRKRRIFAQAQKFYGVVV